MKLAARIAELEARLPAPEREPFGFDSYVELSKALTYPAHENMGPLMVGDRINPHMHDNVPMPEHCLTREQYDSLIWSSADKCTTWITDRCGMYGEKSVCVFLDDRVSGETVTTEQQRQALATTFDGFGLSTIPAHHEILTTEFVCGVIKAVDAMRGQKRKLEEAEQTAEWQAWLGHRIGENPLHREANERARQHRIAILGDDGEPVH